MLSAHFFALPSLLYFAFRVIRLKARRAACRCGGCFSPFAFYLCLSAFICGCFSSIGYASPQPSAENNVHFCLPLNLKDTQVRDSIYAATKHALNLNVGEPRTVRMIYFLPNDRPFRQEVVDRMKVTIRQIQTFYAEQMQAHGHGSKTFRFEIDAQGDPVVHRLDGQYPDSHYLDNTPATVDEFKQVFDTEANNVYLVVIDNSIDAIGSVNGRRVAGVGGGGRNQGSALVPGGFSFHTAAHELGHAFGLHHDFNDDAYIMSYGGDQRLSLSVCNAEFLAVHPYFNSDISDEATPGPTIELISTSVYTAGSKSVSIQLKVSDSDGLHQVILFVRTKEPHSAAGGSEVKDCLGLSGEREAIVEFDYDGVIPSDGFTRLGNPDEHPISVKAVDIQGNVDYEYFELICENCPLTLTKISGDKQQGRPGAELATPLVVAVRDKNGTVLEGVPVEFIVTAGEGKLSGRFTVENTTTDANGRAQSTLTLGPNPGTNTIEVTVPMLDLVTFQVVGIGMPTTPIIGGGYQKWQLPDAASIRLGKGHISYGDRAVAFSPDGQRLAVASGIGVWIYDVATSRELALLSHTDQVTSIAFSRDGTMLASGAGDDTVKLWNVDTGQNIATFYTGPVTSVAFSPDGKTLASGAGAWDGTVKLWDVTTGRTITTLKGHKGFVASVAFSPDGKTLASGLWDDTFMGKVELWNIETRQNIATFEGHTAFVNSIAFSPNGTTLASGSGDGTVKLWDMAMRTNIATFAGHRAGIKSVAFSPDGTMLASGSEDGTIKLWDMVMRTNIATLVRHTDAVNSVDFSPDGTILVSGSEDNTVNLWDVATQNITTLAGHTGSVNSLVFSPNGTTLASGSRNGTVIWDVATQNITALAESHIGDVLSIAFSPDGTTLALGLNSGAIKLWNVVTGYNIITLAERMSSVTSVAFSPDGTTLASGSDKTVKLWDVAKKENITTLEGHTVQVTSVAFSPDGTTLASGSKDNTIRLWDIPKRQNIATLRHSSFVEAVVFSPDGTTLASGSRDKTVKLWDVVTREYIITLSGHAYGVESVAFSPDGRILVSGSEDRTVKLWNVETRENITTLEGHTGFVTSVVFSSDGTTLVSGSNDGTILVWDMSALGLERVSQTTFSLSLDGDGAAGDQAVTSLDVSPGSVVSLQIFGKDIQNADGISVRFEYDATQVLYEGFDPGSILPNAQVLALPSTNPTAIEISLVSFGGKTTVDSGLVGSIRFRTTSTFSGTTLRLVRAELGRGGQREEVTFDNTSVALQLAVLTPDFNSDGRVDLSDFLLFASQFGLSRGDEQYDAKYDLDGDGVIGFGDFLIFGRSFGKEG